MKRCIINLQIYIFRLFALQTHGRILINTKNEGQGTNIFTLEGRKDKVTSVNNNQPLNITKSKLFGKSFEGGVTCLQI